jgi:hypothetical protein
MSENTGMETTYELERLTADTNENERGDSMKTTTKSTPGPWANNKWNCEEHQISAKGGTIALVSHSHTLVPEAEADANAQLIAAAPAMLAALKEYKAHGFARPASDHPEAIEQRRIMDIMEAAIAAATGGEG